MKKIAIPFAVVTVLVFWAPVNEISAVNSVWLLVMLLLFYLFMTTYCTPYNALISELGSNQDTRISISTYISATFILGSAVGYAAPYIWGALEPSMGRIMAIRVTFIILAAIGLVALLVPTFTINEKDYVDQKPDTDDAFRSLGKAFKNKEFRTFVGSDVLYFIALTIFQTGLTYFITSLMGLDEKYTTILYVLMTLLSFVCYAPVNMLAHKYNKKKLVMIGFCGLSVTYGITAMSGMFGIPGIVWGFIVPIIAAFPMAILGILPQAIVADIAQAESVTTGENREGMFFAARTFAFKLGQSLSMLIFTALATIRPDIGLGYRIAAICAFVICLIGAFVLSHYNEKKILGIIAPEKVEK